MAEKCGMSEVGNRGRHLFAVLKLFSFTSCLVGHHLESGKKAVNVW